MCPWARRITNFSPGCRGWCCPPLWTCVKVFHCIVGLNVEYSFHLREVVGTHSLSGGQPNSWCSREQLWVRCLTKGHLSSDLSTIRIKQTTFWSQAQFSYQKVTATPIDLCICVEELHVTSLNLHIQGVTMFVYMSKCPHTSAAVYTIRCCTSADVRFWFEKHIQPLSLTSQTNTSCSGSQRVLQQKKMSPTEQVYMKTRRKRNQVPTRFITLG